GDPDGTGLRDHPRHRGHSRKRRLVSPRRQPERDGEQEHGGDPCVPRHRRDDGRGHAAHRRGPPAQELREAPERESGLFVRERPDRADRIAGRALSRRGRLSRLLGAADRTSARDPRRHQRGVHDECSIQRHGQVGRPQGPGAQVPHGRQEIIGGDYFKAMHIALVAGRPFNDSDTADAPPVCIVDEYLVKKYFANTTALGQQIQRGGPTSPKYTIVGVVGTINSIDLGPPGTKERLLYPVPQSQGRPGAMALVLKTGLDPQSLVPQVRAAVNAIDPEQPIADVRTMEQWLSRSLQNRRTNMTLLTIFGAVAL